MNIEMTGYEDRQGAWKFAIAGQPGAGKTLLASTAQDPLYVLFQQEPRIKSIADRAIPHVKITNDYDSGLMGIDALKVLLGYLSMEEHPYKTFVVDTGDELFQVMKSGRTFENGGEFNIGDWGWISDAYREVMMAVIDLPMNVIVNYHVKTTNDDDVTFKELMLQGAAKDEAAGWFDIVGAIDAFELIDESGVASTRRHLITSPTRSYPWLKDHSNALPRKFIISDDFVGDFPRMLETIAGHPTTGTQHEVLAEITPKIVMPTIQTSGVPSPEDLGAKKRENPEPLPSETAPIDTASTSSPEDTILETGDTNSEKVEQEEAPVAPGASDSQQQVESVDPVAAVQDVLGGEQVFECTVCGTNVTDSDLRELTQIRFRKYMCKPHFSEALAGKGSE